jgi:hypothetical protein
MECAHHRVTTARLQFHPEVFDSRPAAAGSVILITAGANVSHYSRNVGLQVIASGVRTTLVPNYFSGRMTLTFYGGK